MKKIALSLSIIIHMSMMAMEPSDELNGCITFPNSENYANLEHVDQSQWHDEESILDHHVNPEGAKLQDIMKFLLDNSQDALVDLNKLLSDKSFKSDQSPSYMSLYESGLYKIDLETVRGCYADCMAMRNVQRKRKVDAIGFDAKEFKQKYVRNIEGLKRIRSIK